MRLTPATRRRVLAGVCGATAGLAGCLGDDGDDPSTGGDGDDGEGGSDDGADDSPDPGDDAWEPTEVEDAWPQARFGPANAGTRSGDGPSSLSQVWHEPLDATVALSPVAVDDLVLVAPVTFDGDVYALDAATGERRWSTVVGVSPNTEPVVDDGIAYVGDSAGKLNFVRTGDPPDGEAPRLFDLNGELRGAPAVRDGVCYFGAGDGGAYAYDAFEGEFVWEHATDAPIQTPATVVDDAVYLGNDDGVLFARATDDGRELWRYDAGERIRGVPTVVDGPAGGSSDASDGRTVYVGTGEGTVLALDADSGVERWSTEVPDTVADAIPVLDGTAYVADNAATLTALDAATGEERWRVERDGDRITPAPVVTDDALYHHFGDERLLVLDPETGEERASAEIDSHLTSGPTLANGTLYVGAGDGVYAFSE